ncbi:hypothetical protein LPJ55_000654 [Coemansia sp. RSA 990]|nr:nucleolar protein,Nop52-domain-containing protein [Coemansia mojavensis]KAJ1743310.1 hypothetical protein LPJ68_001104 [Coemansia sp. RSA 1086]KAJ1752974.1 hypothetical protein LPJ79_000796 [Coemansia sp. RSA 1821]KAJ1875489.1 hypothetical protein LPJ55_000654 [Coemansia sp. RSA 990]KAJ2674953.1 hypothetical protein IWW42_001455 [Coemansia sp. RSA 1085]
MAELTDKERALGKRLAHVDKSVRDNATASVKVVMSQEEEFSHMEMLRHWKALFYCFWLSDKPLVQQELAWELANLTLVCNRSNGVAFVRAFWETMSREWFDMDKHRIDKYLLLARRMVFFTFKAMQKNQWDQALVEEYLKVYQEVPANPDDPKIPNSIRTHVSDVYVDELVRLVTEMQSESEDAREEAALIPVAQLLEPFMRLISRTPIRHLPPIIQESVFENLVVRIAEAEERSMAQSSDNNAAVPASDVVLDNEITEETVENVQFLIDAIPEIKTRMLAVGGEEESRSSGRKRLYMLYQALCDTFPDEENDIMLPKRITVSEPIGAEERKIADKHKRRKANKKRELKERRKRKSEADHTIISALETEIDANALVSEATADERRNYEADVVKISEMERRAGLIVDEGGSKSPASKKAKRKEKKQQEKVSQKEDIPLLVPINGQTNGTSDASESANGSHIADTTNSFSVGIKASGAAGSNKTKSRLQASTKHSGESEADSLLARMQKSFVIRDKTQDASSVSAGTKPNTPAKQTGNKRASIKKKRLGWALERNSVKPFSKTKPVQPSAKSAKVVANAVANAQLKSALRKESAYGYEPQYTHPPYKLANLTVAKKRRLASA